MQYFNLHIVQFIDTGFGTAHIFGQWVVDGIGSTIAIVDEKREVRRFAQVCDTAGFFYGGAGELGLHELNVGTVVGSLLSGIGRGHCSRRCAIGRIVHGRLVAGFRVGGGSVVVVARSRRAVVGIASLTVRRQRTKGMYGWTMQGWEVSLPLRVLRLDGLRLLALRSGDAAFDGESGTVGAGHPEAGGVASYLMSG